MGFDRKEWIGNWENFELYFTDLDPAMCRAWADAEREIRERKMDLISSILFRHGAKQFWMDGCYTVTEENKVRLGGWHVKPAGENDISVEWLDEAGKSLGCYIYTLDMVLPKGLESKENYLLHAENAPQDSPFAYLLSMPPMPEHAEKEKGGLISHLHFQFGRKKEQITAFQNGHRIGDCTDQDDMICCAQSSGMSQRFIVEIANTTDDDQPGVRVILPVLFKSIQKSFVSLLR